MDLSAEEKLRARRSDMTTQFQTRSEQTPTLWIDRTATPAGQSQYDPRDDYEYDRRRVGVGVNANKLWAGGAACWPAAGCSRCPCWPRTRTATAPSRPPR